MESPKGGGVRLLVFAAIALFLTGLSIRNIGVASQTRSEKRAIMAKVDESRERQENSEEAVAGTKEVFAAEVRDALRTRPVLQELSTDTTLAYEQMTKARRAFVKGGTRAVIGMLDQVDEALAQWEETLRELQELEQFGEAGEEEFRRGEGEQ